MSSDWFDVYSYGSNMAIDRLRSRAPSARLLGAGWLQAHSLRWHKRGRDGSGKCDALFTGKPEDILWGAVFRIKACDRLSLDQAEHLGIGYQIRIVEVNLAEGPRKALMYAAIQIQPKLGHSIGIGPGWRGVQGSWVSLLLTSSESKRLMSFRIQIRSGQPCTKALDLSGKYKF